MLVIRMQRTGRKGHAMFRVVVQDSRRTPTSGKIVAALGSYDPHAKTVSLNKEKAQLYLNNGAQPSDRVVALLKKEGVKLPSWVAAADKKSGTIRNLEKLRRNRTEETAAPEEEPAAEVEAEAPPEAPVEAETEAPAETTEASAETTSEDTAVEASEAEPAAEAEVKAEEAAPEPAEQAEEVEPKA